MRGCCVRPRCARSASKAWQPAPPPICAALPALAPWPLVVKGLCQKHEFLVFGLRQVCDLSLLTVDEEEFWAAGLMALAFVDVPQLQCAFLPTLCQCHTCKYSQNQICGYYSCWTRDLHASSMLARVKWLWCGFGGRDEILVAGYPQGVLFAPLSIDHARNRAASTHDK